MSKWQEQVLGSILKPKGYIRGPFGSSLKRDEMLDRGIPVYEQKNAIYNDRTFRYFISDEKLKELKRFQVDTNDLIISCSGTVGKISIIGKDDPKGIISQALLILRPDVEKVLLKYLYYFLSSNTGYNLITQVSHGSVQVNIAERSIVETIPIPLPPISIQEIIAEVLSSLDDKINLLHRQNQTLEQIAETLFRKCFVEEAKEEWEHKSLSSIANFLNGLACQKFPPKNEIEKLPVLKIKDLKDGFTDNSDWASTDIDHKYFVKNGDVIFSWSASLVVKIWDGVDCILNQHLFKVSSDIYPKWFYYLWSKYHLQQFIAIASAHATTMGHIKRGDLDEAMVSVPSKSELDFMSETFQPILEKIILNNKQIKTLVNQRDTLLPKLMSGEVRVKTT